MAAALVANGDGLELDVRSDLDPERAKAQPGFFSAFSSFVPTLGASLPPDSLAYIGIGDPGKTLKSLLEQASTEEPGLASAVGNLVQRVKKLGDVNLEKDLLPSLGREAAFALEPSPGGVAGKNAGGQSPSATLPISATPFLEFVAAGVDSDRAGQALDVSLFGYLNLEGLVALGEAAGLAEDPAYATFAPEVRSLQALGLTVQSDPHELATDVRLIVGEPEGGGGPGVSRSD